MRQQEFKIQFEGDKNIFQKKLDPKAMFDVGVRDEGFIDYLNATKYDLDQSKLNASVVRRQQDITRVIPVKPQVVESFERPIPVMGKNLSKQGKSTFVLERKEEVKEEKKEKSEKKIQKEKELKRLQLSEIKARRKIAPLTKNYLPAYITKTEVEDFAKRSESEGVSKKSIAAEKAIIADKTSAIKSSQKFLTRRTINKIIKKMKAGTASKAEKSIVSSIDAGIKMRDTLNVGKVATVTAVIPKVKTFWFGSISQSCIDLQIGISSSSLWQMFTARLTEWSSRLVSVMFKSYFFTQTLKSTIGNNIKELEADYKEFFSLENWYDYYAWDALIGSAKLFHIDNTITTTKKENDESISYNHKHELKVGFVFTVDNFSTIHNGSKLLAKDIKLVLNNTWKDNFFVFDLDILFQDNVAFSNVSGEFISYLTNDDREFPDLSKPSTLYNFNTELELRIPPSQTYDSSLINASIQSVEYGNIEKGLSVASVAVQDSKRSRFFNPYKIYTYLRTMDVDVSNPNPMLTKKFTYFLASMNGVRMMFAVNITILELVKMLSSTLSETLTSGSFIQNEDVKVERTVIRMQGDQMFSKLFNEIVWGIPVEIPRLDSIDTKNAINQLVSLSPRIVDPRSFVVDVDGSSQTPESFYEGCSITYMVAKGEVYTLTATTLLSQGKIKEANPLDKQLQPNTVKQIFPEILIKAKEEIPDISTFKAENDNYVYSVFMLPSIITQVVPRPFVRFSYLTNIVHCIEDMSYVQYRSVIVSIVTTIYKAAIASNSQRLMDLKTNMFSSWEIFFQRTPTDEILLDLLPSLPFNTGRLLIELLLDEGTNDLEVKKYYYGDVYKPAKNSKKLNTAITIKNVYDFFSAMTSVRQAFPEVYDCIHNTSKFLRAIRKFIKSSNYTGINKLSLSLFKLFTKVTSIVTLFKSIQYENKLDIGLIDKVIYTIVDAWIFSFETALNQEKFNTTSNAILLLTVGYIKSFVIARHCICLLHDTFIEVSEMVLSPSTTNNFINPLVKILGVYQLFEPLPTVDYDRLNIFFTGYVSSYKVLVMKIGADKVAKEAASVVRNVASFIDALSTTLEGIKSTILTLSLLRDKDIRTISNISGGESLDWYSVKTPNVTEMESILSIKLKPLEILKNGLDIYLNSGISVELSSVGLSLDDYSEMTDRQSFILPVTIVGDSSKHFFYFIREMFLKCRDQEAKALLSDLIISWGLWDAVLNLQKVVNASSNQFFLQNKKDLAIYLGGWETIPATVPSKAFLLSVASSYVAVVGNAAVPGVSASQLSQNENMDIEMGEIEDNRLLHGIARNAANINSFRGAVQQQQAIA